jgi:hypothetical protein
VVLLVSGLILCAASACGQAVPGQADKGTPGVDTSRPAVPAAAWLDAASLPLNDIEHWPDLADLAQPLTDGAFESQALCHVPADPTLTAGTHSARARIDRSSTP